MEHSKLSDHYFKKGKFITPWNNLLGNMTVSTNWFNDRMPEYLWLGLILDYLGRKNGLEKCYEIIMKLNEISENKNSLAWSEIIAMDDEKQNQIFDFIIEKIDKNVLNPLTIIFTYSKCPIFAVKFFEENSTYIKRKEIVEKVIEKSYGHQTDFATDIRFLIVYYSLIKEKIHIPKDELDLLLRYPHIEHSNSEMHIIRPSIRSLELVTADFKVINENFINEFWERISKIMECKPFYIEYKEQNYDTDIYIEKIRNIIEYLSEILCKVDQMDSKKNVLVGIATYSYKLVCEIEKYNLYNTISARLLIRCLIENYIMMKYLIKREKEHQNIWEEYKYYGIGLYKLIVERYRESNIENNGNRHINYEYLDLLINEFIGEEYIDMDTRYFDKQNIREKANYVGEKELYGLYYDYDSSFEHGLWGAIRESALIKCNSPSHQYHCIPDYKNEQKLKSVWNDTITIMNKIVFLLDELYELPYKMIEEVKKFEQSNNG